MDIFVGVRAQVVAALEMVVPDLPAEIAGRVEVTPAREASHGDMASNAAMVAAKFARQKPQVIAAALVERLGNAGDIASAEAAGPGFVNIRLRPELLRAQLPVILRAGEAYGDGAARHDPRINIEYVSCNPTGPMHVGHCRGAVVGDALANVLIKAGYPVTKEFYVNDAGGQVVALAWATYWRYLQALGSALTDEAIDAASGGLQYRGEYLVPVGEALAAAHGAALAGPGLGIAPASLWMDTVRQFAVGALMAEIREDLAALGVCHDVFTSERAVLESGAVDRALGALQARGLLYEGVLEPPKGRTPEDWEPRPQTLFRATEFGDDLDRPLRKSDGSNTYFANDIAYHVDKIARGADAMIDVWGADHGGYISRLRAAMRALAPTGETLDIVVCQIVRVVRAGEPVRMSKRAGTFVTLRDLIDEVGAAAVRFTMLTRRADAQMDFDLDAVVAQTRENPVFYVQYAHARCRSVLRAAAELYGDAAADAALADAPLDTLTAAPETALLRRLIEWPRVVQSAAAAREPHRIAFYLYDLAADFHALWSSGREDTSLRFLQDSDPVGTHARLALVAATAVVLRSGLAVVGVEPVEEMR